MASSKRKTDKPPEIPVLITFRDIDASPAVEARIRIEAQKLSRYHSRIVDVRVVVDVPHRNHHKGKIHHVAVDVSVPGGEIVANRDPQLNHAHEDIYVAVRDSFRAARRQLEDRTRRLRGDVKTHEVPPHGRVVRMFPDHGFIGTADGEEVYFHRNAVANGEFDKLDVGAEVRIALSQGEKGPQASTVTAIGKHHPT